MFANLPDIWNEISCKVVFVVCGRKIKNSWLYPFFNQSSNYLMQKFWMHDTFFKFPIENLYFKRLYSN